MLLLISGSFYLYSIKNEEIVSKQNRLLGEVVANAAFLEAHVTTQEDDPSIAVVDKLIADRLRRRSHSRFLLGIFERRRMAFRYLVSHLRLASHYRGCFAPCGQVVRLEAGER